MKILAIIVLYFCASLSTAQDIATFRNNTVLIPQVRVGEEVVQNVVLTPHKADSFLVTSIGSSSISDEKAVARYFPESGIAEIDYVTLGVNAYRDIRLLSVGNELLLQNATPLFSDKITTVVTPDSYQPSSPSNGSVQIPIAVLDLNGDGRQDLVAHLWEKINVAAGFRGPVSDNLVIYLQTEDGNFRIATKEILGSEFVSLGGASRKSVIGDFNQDGYPDIAYAMNKEDGRPYIPGSDVWFTNPAVLISNGDGSYRIDILPSISYYHSVDTRITSSGHVDIVFNGLIESEPSHAYRYINDKPVSVSTYPYLDPGAFVFEKSGDRTVSKRILAFITRDHFEKGVAVDFMALRLFEEIGNQWELVDQYIFDREKTARKFLFSDSNQIEEYKVLRMNGVNKIDSSIYEICSMTAPDGESVFIVSLASKEVPDKLVDGVNYLSTRWVDFSNEYLAFKVINGKLQYVPGFINQQDDDIHSLWFSCSDGTNDGLQDVISQNLIRTDWSYEVQDRGLLTIYKSSSEGFLERVDPRIFPRPSTVDFPPMLFRRAIYMDLNGDGIRDVLYYASNSKLSTPGGGYHHSPVSFYIYWGLNDIF